MALAPTFATLGDIERGLKRLERAFEERTLWLVFVRVDHALALPRVDPRFAALVGSFTKLSPSVRRRRSPQRSKRGRRACSRAFKRK